MRARTGKSSAHVRAAGGFDFFDEKIHEAFVKVVAAEAGVAVGGEHLENAVVQFEDGQIEGAAAEIVDGDLRVGP